MKHKVSDLEGALLDLAVAIAEGATDARIVVYGGEPTCITSLRSHKPEPFMPSQRGSDGQPIIERELISTIASGTGGASGDQIEWSASAGPYTYYIDETLPLFEDWAGVGPTALIAAMRAWVLKKIGPEIDLPN